MGPLGEGLATKQKGMWLHSLNILMENSNSTNNPTEKKRLSVVTCCNNKTKNKNLSFFGFPEEAEGLVVKFLMTFLFWFSILT